MYSQNSEESVIISYFRLHTGTLLSLGENDGKTLSNCLALIEKGWKAVLVEPDSSAFIKLKALHGTRENVQMFNVAIGNEDGQATFYESGTHLHKNDIGLLSSLKPSELTRWPETEFNPVQVDVWTFDTLLYNSPVKKFDFISIDCEGMDLEILQQIDLKAVGASCVCVEWNGKEEWMFDRIFKQVGMKKIHMNGENLIYGL